MNFLKRIYNKFCNKNETVNYTIKNNIKKDVPEDIKDGGKDKIKEKAKSETQNEKSSINYMVVGLGNPGLNYFLTRHNVGFMAIDYISKELNVDIQKDNFEGLYTITNVNNKKILLLKPQTFMNNSGESVRQVMNFYKVNSQNVILIYDDISFEVGNLRIKRRGSHGGQNGVKNILELCGSENFPRIKIGIGNKPSSDWSLSDWVLSRFSREEVMVLNKAFKSAYEAFLMIIDGKIDAAMNKFN